MSVRAGINTVRSQWDYVYSEQTQSRLAEILDFDPALVPQDGEPEEYRASLAGARVILSTWGAHPLSADILELCPDLELVVYAAGSVKGFLTPEFMDRKIPVCSAVHLNAQPVAEFTLGMILMALKQVFGRNEEIHRRGPDGWHKGRADAPGGYYHSKVGLLGYGRITSLLLPLLANFELDVYLSEPYLSDEEVRELGVNPASLEEIMATCEVVSLHHANTPANRNLINASNLRLLQPGAHFINTSRGQLVNEDDLVDRLRAGDITAYLDVTYPEPPGAGHPFYSLPNCILTPHVAGSLGREVHRMGDYALREVENWLAGRPLENRIDLETVFDRA